MKVKTIFSLLIFLLIFVNEIYSQAPTVKTIDYAKLTLNNDLLKGSRWAVEQRKTKRLIQVFHAIEVVDISKVDVDTMSVRVELHLRQRWEADDLNLPEGLFSDTDAPDVFIQSDAPILDSLWSPDSYIPLARDTKISRMSMSEQSIVNIFRNKTIVFKARLYTILGCLFDFQWYPLDRQDCYLTIESYNQPDYTVRYLWETNQEPLIYSNLKLLQYSLKLPMEYSNGSAERWGRGGKYPFVSLKFSFERQLSHQVIQVFVPTTLVVVLSWFSFWLGLDAIPGRIALLITCMLTLVTMHSGKSTIPPVNYIKMMDLWMVGCISFVFMALCEFVIVKYLHWKKMQELKVAESNKKEMELYLIKIKEIEEHNNCIGVKKDLNPYLEFYKNMNMEAKLGHVNMKSFEESQRILPFPTNPNMKGPLKRNLWMGIDRVSRIMFPLAFVIFNACFWPWLFIGAANQ